jgi:hypothetical protein
MNDVKTLVDLRAEFRRLQASGARPRRGALSAPRVLVLAAVLVLGLAAGALAVTGTGIGVPALDRLLDRKAPDERSAPTTAPRFPNERPGPGGASEVLSVRLGNVPGVAAAYATAGGSICSAKAPRDADASSGPRGTTGNCLPPDVLADQLRARGAVCCGLADEDGARIVDGYVSADVVSVRLLTGQGETRAELTPVWSPAMPGAGSLRYFVASTPGTATLTREDGMLDLPSLELTFEDGKVTEIRP